MNADEANKMLDAVTGSELLNTNILASYSVGKMNAIQVTLAFANNSLANAIAAVRHAEKEGDWLMAIVKDDLVKSRDRLRAAADLLDTVL